MVTNAAPRLRRSRISFLNGSRCLNRTRFGSKLVTIEPSAERRSGMTVELFMAKKLPGRGRSAVDAVAALWPEPCRSMANTWPMSCHAVAAEIAKSRPIIWPSHCRNSLTPLGVQRPYENSMFPQALSTPELAPILSAILDKMRVTVRSGVLHRSINRQEMPLLVRRVNEDIPVSKVTALPLIGICNITKPSPALVVWVERPELRTIARPI
jgi:hypothetical protein